MTSIHASCYFPRSSLAEKTPKPYFTIKLRYSKQPSPPEATVCAIKFHLNPENSETKRLFSIIKCKIRSHYVPAKHTAQLFRNPFICNRALWLFALTPARPLSSARIKWTAFLLLVWRFSNLAACRA